MNSSCSSQRWWFWAGLVLVVVIWCMLFAPAMWGTHRFGYRDSAFLYQPLFEWTAAQWLSGQVPLWCPLDGWGVPVVGDTTTSVFYPGKLIFLFKFIPFPALFGWYVALHVLLALAATIWCARVMGCSRPAQLLAAVGYAFGGSVLFQSCNVVFLVSAAWLPLALGMIWRFRESQQFSWLMGLAVVMALMVLGGDPQMAYHVALILGAALLWSALSGRHESIRKRVTIAGLSFGFAAGMAIALAAIQILPTIDWSSRSERAIHDQPRTVYDVIKAAADDGWTATQEAATATIARPPAGTHRDAVYEFSMPPWNLAELVWPNVLGKTDFVTSTRWSSQLPGADRIWTGSIYLGLTVFLLAFTQLISRGRRPVDMFLIAIGLFFALASFGWYGPGWLINELQLMRGGAGTGHTVGEPTGGLYWLMEVLLPWYSAFRYPAKLFVVAALAICLLGGRGLDRLTNEQHQSVENGRFTQVCFRDSLMVVLVTWTVAISLHVMAIWEPQTGSGFISLIILDEISAALWHTCVVATLIAVLLVLLVWRAVAKTSIAWLLTGLTAVEIAVALSWTIALIPVAEIETTSPPDLSQGRMWLFYGQNPEDKYPPAQDLAMQYARDVDHRRPKFNLTSGERQLNTFHSIEPLDALLFRYGLQQQIALVDRWIQNLDRWYLATGELTMSCFDETDYRDAVDATHHVLQMPGEESRHWTHVDCDEDVPDGVVTTPLQDGEAVIGMAESLTRLDLHVSTRNKRLVVVADYFDEDWHATIETGDGNVIDTAILRVNRIMRGVVVPAGDSQITMTYRPRSFYRGAWISCLAWLAMILWLVRPRRFG